MCIRDRVNWIPVRGSALDNDNVKNAVMQYGGTYVSLGWYGSSSGSTYYNATTKSYYYDGASGTNHGVVIVGWDDNYAAGNFATTPPGNGAFIVRNSWGSSWGSGGYFYVSYYDTTIGLWSPMAVFNGAQSTSNYIGLYQYDPLGEVTSVGYGSTTGWFANVFTAQANASLSAVGFYTEVPGASYEVYTGSSLATKALNTTGTMTYMGYHTVTLATPVGVTNGQPFVVAVKMTSPGYDWPMAVEYPEAGYSDSATAAAGQSYISPDGMSWSDLTGAWAANANVCLKAYVKAPVTPPPTITAIGPTSGPAGTSVTLTGTDLTGATAVTFNGVAAASFSVGSATQVTASVPATATTGPVAVTTPGGVGTGPTFTVTPPALAITVPSITGTYAQNSALSVNWTTNTTVAGGEFAVWAVSPGGWYVGKTVAADGSAAYATTVNLGVPQAGGYSIWVGYRATAGSGAWTVFGQSSGSFTVN